MNLGAILAALPGAFAIWVALTASITAALLGWQELRKVDETIKNYSKVVVELSILYNHWQNLESDDRTASEFEKMVLGCERILRTQIREYVRSMQEALREVDIEKDAAFINQVIKESADSVQGAKEKLHENIIETYQGFLAETGQNLMKLPRPFFPPLQKKPLPRSSRRSSKPWGKPLPKQLKMS